MKQATAYVLKYGPAVITGLQLLYDLVAGAPAETTQQAIATFLAATGISAAAAGAHKRLDQLGA